MEYRRFENVIVLRLDPEEEICGKLIELAEKESIALASVQGLGAIKELTTGVFDTVTKEYHANTFQGALEIVSLTGTLTQKDKAPYLHVHLSAGDSKGNVFGGHLNRAVVSATAEIVLQILPGQVGRKFSDRIGLNLFEF